MSGQRNGYDCRARLTTRMQPLDSRLYPKVVVVGAGMAGLSATRELRRRGWPKDRVVLLEATESIGGRMRTRRHQSGVLCDLGAGYVHGTIGNPLTELANDAGIKLTQVCEVNPWVEDTSSVVLCGGGERAAELEVATTNEAFRELLARMSAMAQKCDDCNASAGDAVEGVLLEEPFCSLSEREMARLRLRLWTLSLWYGCDLRDLQLRSLEIDHNCLPDGQGVFGDFPGPHCMVEGGVERLVHAVANPQVRECLSLNAPVRRVSIISASGNGISGDNFSGGNTSSGNISDGNISEEDATEGTIHVSIKKKALPPKGVAGMDVGPPEEEVEEEEEVVRGDAVIVAIPLSLMQAGVVEFDPPLREASRLAMSRLRMGTYEKITMQFKEVFWPNDAPFIGCCPVASPGDDSSSPPLSAASPTGARPLPYLGNSAASSNTLSGPSLPHVQSSSSSSSRTVPNGHPHTPTAMPTPTPSGDDRGTVPPAELVSTTPVTAVAAAAVAVAAAVTKPSSSAVQASREAFDALSVANPAIFGPAPIFLENYLWSKGVPVLTAALTGERGRAVSAVAAVAAAGAVADKTGNRKGDDAWREAHATEVYVRLVKPTLIDAFGKGKEIPEPLSVTVTSWANEPCQRGSYSYFPVGARDEDTHSAGQGAAIGLAAEAGPGTKSRDRVFFAGEATSAGYEGSMHGAYLTGLRAVEDAVRAFDVPF